MGLRTMLDDPATERRIGSYAWVMAWVGLVVGQLHALARFATEDGREDLELPLTRAWAEPAAELLAPLLEWGDPDLVYFTYGKVWFPVFVGFTLAAFAVHRRRSAVRLGGIERWVWRVVLTGYVAACVGVFLDYWTQWTGDANVLFSVGWVVTFPSFLLVMVGSTVLGTTLLVRGFRPLLPALLLAGTFPLAFFVILQVTSMGSAALPIMFAFGLLGRRLHEDTRPPADAQNETVGGVSWPAGAS